MLIRKKPLLILYHVDPDFVCEKRYAFAIRGFALAAVDGVTEIGIEHVNVATIPGDLYCVANCAFNPGRGGSVLFGNGRIKTFGDGVRRQIYQGVYWPNILVFIGLYYFTIKQEKLQKRSPLTFLKGKRERAP